MKLYDYGASCNCYKVRLLLANLGRDYERVPVDIFNGETLTEEFVRMNPARTSSWWLATVASAGFSFRVGTNDFDIRMQEHLSPCP